MPRTGVTQAQVYEAADALVAEGTKPTVKAIQERTTGSFSTITPYLAAWRQEREGPGTAPRPEMPKSVESAFQRVWGVAVQTAQQALETERQALAAARREMAQEKAEMAEEIARLERALNEAAEQGERWTEQLKQAQQAGMEKEVRLQALALDKARLEERLHAAEARAGELKAQVERLENAWVAASQTPARAGAPETDETDGGERAAPKA